MGQGRLSLEAAVATPAAAASRTDAALEAKRETNKETVLEFYNSALKRT